MKLLILNGPNLNLLGIRKPELYGTADYASLVRFCEETCRELGLECECFQSNHEGVLVDRIQACYGTVDGIVINAAAYTHTSVAIADALEAVSVPAVEVHLTDVNAREDFRRVSYLRPQCIDCFSGFGFEGYRKAILRLKEYLSDSD